MSTDPQNDIRILDLPVYSFMSLSEIKLSLQIETNLRGEYKIRTRFEYLKSELQLYMMSFIAII